MNEIKLAIGNNSLEASGYDLYGGVETGLSSAITQFINAAKEVESAKAANGGLHIGITPPEIKPQPIKGEILFSRVGETEPVVLKQAADTMPGAEHDVVAIYDEAGIPSIMHRFRKITNAELFGGSEAVNAAFKIGGEEYDEIYISVYENCNINGKPYSLPYQKAWTNITNDDAAKACFSKGEGWHMMTAAEWGLLANLCKKSGIFPHGNTDYGKYHADKGEAGEKYDGSYTLTGSGPQTWTHDHTPTGVHDLCGNHWEMVRGMRARNGVIQAAKDNDAALDIDLSLDSALWEDVKDDDGRPCRFTVDGDNAVSIISGVLGEKGYSGSEWQDVEIKCQSERLKELALYAGEPEAYLYADSTDGEYFPLRGGNFSHASGAGVFISYFSLARSLSGVGLGFRSAFFRKR